MVGPELFRFIDWLMHLPAPLVDLYLEEVDNIQKERKMPFVSTPERVGLREGMKEGIEPALKIKFGDAALKLMPEIDNIHELAQLHDTQISGSGYKSRRRSTYLGIAHAVNSVTKFDRRHKSQRPCSN